MNTGQRTVVAVVAALLGLSGQAVADIINVPADQPTIQAGIDAAVNGDEVVVAPGTYFENINFLGKAITLRSSDGAELTIIDAQQTGRVVTCVSGEGADTILDGFTITGGNANTGGGMYNDGSSPTVTNCTFIDNTATVQGGGMYNSKVSPTVTDCTFEANTSGSDGGGMWNNGGSPTVTNCTFDENTAAVRGGGMYSFNGSSPTVTNCTFTGNTAALLEGGGMLNSSASPTIINCTFSGNTAGSLGGGMWNTGGSPAVTNCILWGDSPDEIFLHFSTTTVSYSDVQGGHTGTGNIDADPMFVDPDNGDLRLLPGSPCIDAGDNTAVPVNVTTDLDGNPRFVDDANTPDTGNGTPPIVDMGAYEMQDPPVPCVADIDLDGFVGVPDLLLVLAQWGVCPPVCLGDINGDGSVNVPDLLLLLANWGPCL